MNTPTSYAKILHTTIYPMHNRQQGIRRQLRQIQQGSVRFFQSNQYDIKYPDLFRDLHYVPFVYEKEQGSREICPVDRQILRR